MDLFAVALGGAFGAVCRYGMSRLPFAQGFPFATFLTNLLGAFVIGLVAGLAEQKRLPSASVLFLKTGFCGGFTTFSTFSLESVGLLTEQRYLTGTAYIVLSLLCCLTGVLFGQLCAKHSA